VFVTKSGLRGFGSSPGAVTGRHLVNQMKAAGAK